jgi:hypothetical protein
MKKLNAETQRFNAATLEAANDAIMHPVAAPKLVSAAHSWDPHEVWRTRILPYQRQQRLRSSADLQR